MTFKAYLDNIENLTGVSPEQWTALFKARGFAADTKATPVTDWLKSDYKLGHGHAMAIVKQLRIKGLLA